MISSFIRLGLWKELKVTKIPYHLFKNTANYKKIVNGRLAEKRRIDRQFTDLQTIGGTGNGWSAESANFPYLILLPLKKVNKKISAVP